MCRRRVRGVRRALFVNLCLSLGVTLLMLAALEGGARLFERPRPQRPEVADYIWDWDDKMPGGFYVMKSDAVGWPPWEEFNADGLRDRTRPHERPDLVRRVAFLGDSVTLGAEIRPEEAYPRVLEARLAGQGTPFEAMSVALWGWSTRQERIAWRRIARRYAPDLAVLAVCLNDIPELHNNLSRPPRWLSELHNRSALVRLVVGAEGREIDSVERLFAEPDAPRVKEALGRFFEEVRTLRREVEADGAGFAMVVFPFRFQVMDGAPAPVVQQRIVSFCREEGIRCLDLLPTLLRLGPAAFVDYDHLTPDGARSTVDALLASGLLPRASAATDVLAVPLRAAAAPAGLAAAAWLASAGGTLAPAGADALAAQLAAEDGEVRAAAAWALGRGGVSTPLGVAALARALRSDASTTVRGRAAGALAGVGARTAAPALFDALEDPSEAVRFEAARALTALGPTAADVPRLGVAVGSADDFVSAFAAWALGNLGEAARPAVPALARALGRERIDTVVAGALARIGPAAADAVPALVGMLQSADPGRRWRGARTLGRIGNPAEAAVPALVVALRDDRESLVRGHAARALGRVRPSDRREAAAALQRATGDADEGVRREARQALERLQGAGEGQ